MSKNERQMNFVDEMANPDNRSNRTARFLDKLAAVVDFTPIEAALREAYTATRGRDPHDPLVMFKMTLLQHFYDLSDPECEAQAADRRSFRKFCGLGLADRVPDETALVRFRARLVARGLHTRLLGLVNAQIEARGLMVKTVTLVDATIVESARRKPTKTERAEGTQGDPEAGYATKGGRAYYGFKAHITADEAHTLIRTAELTAANVHDSRKFKDVCPADTEVAVADKAYASAEYEAWLAARGIHSGIMQLAARNHPLSREQQEDKIFGHWKRVLG
jgi:IS5 family transposase